MQVKTPPVNRFQKQDGSLGYETEVSAEGKIGNGVPHQQEAEKTDRYPEQGGKKIPGAVLQGQQTGVGHEFGFRFDAAHVNISYRQVVRILLNRWMEELACLQWAQRLFGVCYYICSHDSD
jgi:hypothetical protein